MALYCAKSILIFMTTTMAKEQELAVAVDTFAALEQRVVRAIELLNREREQRSATERQLSSLREQLDDQGTQVAMLKRELEELHHERDTVRTRVERLMASLDAIEAS
jgi:chromosome segregation ATPase